MGCISPQGPPLALRLWQLMTHSVTVGLLMIICHVACYVALRAMLDQHRWVLGCTTHAFCCMSLQAGLRGHDSDIPPFVHWPLLLSNYSRPFCSLPLQPRPARVLPGARH
jgi:hypothetical protein